MASLYLQMCKKWGWRDRSDSKRCVLNSNIPFLHIKIHPEITSAGGGI
jgi:hypothetical protein